MIPKIVADLIREVAKDKTSGAVELTRKGAEALLLLADQTAAQDTPQLLSELLGTGRKLIEAQPSMAPLFTLVHTVLSSLDAAQDVGEARQAITAAARGFAADLGLRGEKIALEALSLIPNGVAILTHSRSSTVSGALLLAKERGRSFRVLCTESRPLYEGRELARELGQQGIETTLITEAAVAHFMSEIDLVMVGADSVSRQGLVNKMGTHALALVAHAYGVPFYALCGTEKFLPPDYPYLEIQLKDPQEVWEDHPKGVTVLNYYFDVTPLEHVNGLVTENGLLNHADLVKMLSRPGTHELLV